MKGAKKIEKIDKREKNEKREKSPIKILAIMFWIAIWGIAAKLMNQELLLASPLSVLKQITGSLGEISFWSRVVNTYFHITIGFLSAIFLGIILATLSHKFNLIKILLNPLMSVIKAVPVAAIIILFLIWTDSKNLSIVISVFMTLPTIYVNILKGLEEVDKNLLEMAQMFRIPRIKKIIYIYISQIIPYLESGAVTALGLAWKSGIAAEVIGLPENTIGEILYESKIYLNTVDLFAWAIIIILLGFLSEKIFLYIIKYCIKRIESRD